MSQFQRFKVNSPTVVHEMIDGEVVIVNLEKGDYFSLIKAGADIWEGITKNLTKEEILQAITQRYDGIYETIENSVNQLIEQLQQEELITLDLTDEPPHSKEANMIVLPEKLTFEPPSLQKYTDMEELLALDPIHEVDDAAGWPNAKVTV